jgi:trk system potassium uptake protein
LARDHRFPFRREVGAATAAPSASPGGSPAARPHHHAEVLVIGLGRFGSALAEALVGLGHEVLGIDADAGIVQDLSTRLTHAAQADSTNVRALEQLGAKDFPIAVVGIGGDIEASILTTAALVDLGVQSIWAKAITESHGRILERVGAHHVVFPEHDMGQRVAHLVTGRMMDYIELDEGFALVETRPPADVVGKTLGGAGIRQRYGVTVVCIKPEGEPFTYATAETVIKEGDLLLVAGENRQAQRFADLT